METKKCTCCGEEKNIENFSFKNKSKGIRHSRCKECTRKKDNEYYRNNKARQENVKLNKEYIIERNKSFIEDYKKHNKCKKCGIAKFYILDFHHRNSEDKEFEISRMRDYSLEKIQLEIDKCDLLCANCHREFHFLQQNKNITYKEYLEG